MLLRRFLIFDTGTPLNNFTNSGKYRVHKVISLHGTTVSKPKSTNSKNRKGSRDQHRRTSTSDGAIEQQIQGQHPDDDPKDLVEIEIKYTSGDIKKIRTQCRIDTKNELEYYKNGGILQYVLRKMI